MNRDFIQPPPRSEKEIPAFLDGALQTTGGLFDIFSALEKRRIKAMETPLEPKKAIEEFCAVFCMFGYLTNKIDGLKKFPKPEHELIKDTIKVKAHYSLWCACQELRNLFKKYPPHITWFAQIFPELNNYNYISLIMLENLSELWGALEFTVVEKQFEALFQKKAMDEAFSQERLSFIKSLFILFQGDLKTFLTKRFGEKSPSTEDIALLGEKLVKYRLLRSAQTCLESIPTPEFCKENKRWHNIYNIVLRYTGQHDKALPHRWEYFQAVRTYDAMTFYLDPLGEQLTLSLTENRFMASASHIQEYILKANQAIIHEFPLEDAINLSIKLRGPSNYKDLMDDIMLRHYGSDELSQCPSYALKKLLDQITDERKSDSGGGPAAIPILAPLVASRILIQRKWRNKDQMSAQKSKELSELIEEAKQRDRKLRRTATTQHIPSHQEFMKHLRAKHSQEANPPHQPSSPESTL